MKTDTNNQPMGITGSDTPDGVQYFAFPNGDTYELNLVKLSNGGIVTHMSAHPFKFSDGSEVKGNPDMAKVFTLQRLTRHVKDIITSTGEKMGVYDLRMILDQEQLSYLKVLNDCFDVVILPFPVLVSLREMGIRDQFPKCLAFNATVDTQRSAPQDKVIDINNWSW